MKTICNTELTYWELKEAKQKEELDTIRENANRKSLSPLFKGDMKWPEESVLRKLKARGKK